VACGRHGGRRAGRCGPPGGCRRRATTTLRPGNLAVRACLPSLSRLEQRPHTPRRSTRSACFACSRRAVPTVQVRRILCASGTDADYALLSPSGPPLRLSGSSASRLGAGRPWPGGAVHSEVRREEHAAWATAVELARSRRSPARTLGRPEPTPEGGPGLPEMAMSARRGDLREPGRDRDGQLCQVGAGRREPLDVFID
jgi:hypothetical protein